MVRHFYSLQRSEYKIRKILTVIIILGFIVLGAFVIVPFRSEPPIPLVTAGNKEIPTTQGSYCWEGLFSAECVDKVYTSVLDMAKEYQPTVVSPNEEIKMDFKKEPETMVVERWIGNEHKETIEVKNSAIVVPNEEGSYIYHVLGYWKQGDVDYVFMIEVK